MQKLIIIRGHSGSGKTTFALEKIREFQQTYPTGKIFHIENDHFLTINGIYRWTVERFQIAKQQAQLKLNQAFEFCQQHQTQDVLIVISNVGGNLKEIGHIIEIAEQCYLQVSIYRLQNFFINTHQVDQQTVYEMYIHLCESPIENEILLEPIQPMTVKVRSEIEKLWDLKRKNRYTKKM